MKVKKKANTETPFVLKLTADEAKRLAALADLPNWWLQSTESREFLTELYTELVDDGAGVDHGPWAGDYYNHHINTSL